MMQMRSSINYVIYLGAMFAFSLPSMSFDGNDIFNFGQQYQSRQPNNQRSEPRQQYSYGGPAPEYGRSNDSYSRPPGFPSDPSYLAPSTRDAGERPRRRKRRHVREGDESAPPRRERRHAISRNDDDEDQPRRRAHRRAISRYGPDDNEPQRRRIGSYRVGVPGYGSILACVRTCDGSFFPVGRVSSPNLDPQQALCRGLCPDAQTELFLMPFGADGISTAVSKQGVPYSKMPYALRYTKKRVEACTCHGRSGQDRLVSAFKDFTMRRGDAIMTPNGLQIFLGSYHWPYRQPDFQVLDKAKYILPNGLALAEVEKATKPLQGPARKSDDDDADGPADDSEPTFVTGVDGKKVRVIGDLQIFAPSQKSSVVSASPATALASPEVGFDPPSASPLLRGTTPAPAMAATPPDGPAMTGSIVPLWRPKAAVR